MAMFGASEKQLHWTQKIALIRHNLHTARQSGDFTFFKMLQAQAFCQGSDYVAIINAALPQDCDTTLNTLDNLNTGMVYVFQDAFKNVYDGMKVLVMGRCQEDDKHDHQEHMENMKAQIRVDVLQQIQRADLAIDRIVNSAIALIQLQPSELQNDIASAWVLGVTIMADGIALCLREMNGVESCLSDFIRLENNWATVQSAVESSVVALRGILNLMALDESTEQFKRRSSSSSASAMHMLRRFSTALGMGNAAAISPPPPYRSSHSRVGSHGSAASSQSHTGSPSALRNGFANAFSIKMPKTPTSGASSIGTNGWGGAGAGTGGQLSTIPATPAADPTGVEMVDPFEKSLSSPYNGDRVDGGRPSKHDHRFVKPQQIEMVDPLHIDVGA